MEIKRAACVPLLVQDPYTSVWSGTDAANEGDTIHWSGKKQRIFVSVCLAGSEYRLVGGPPQETEADSQSTGGCQQVMTQVKTYVTATSTTFVYENDAFLVRLVFTTPLLAQDLTLLSRPCSYIDASLDSRIPAAAGEEAFLKVTLTSDLVSSEAGAELIFPAGTTKKGRFISMGRADQHPLGGSGDNVTIDWGYAYLAAQGEKCLFRVGEPGQSVTAEVPFEAQSESGSRRDAHLVFAYDDLISANYFGQWRRAYWSEVYPDILAAIDDAMTGREETLARAAQLDRLIEEKAEEAIGPDYVYLCDLSYRQTIAAHKLVTDEEGNLLFLSKENDSNGCIGTVDVSYPSVPLFLWLNPKLVKAMLRPVFAFANSDAWTFNFAPHDVGRYPYAWGQVYGLKEKPFGQSRYWTRRDGAVYPPFYQYRGEDGLYDLNFQMPVEECGNMLIMTAAVCMAENDVSFSEPFIGLLTSWKDYLLKHGADPAGQLCTDDFAGHLSHNTNLAVKAVMGIEAYSQICRMGGKVAQADEAHREARAMAASWEMRAEAGGHTSLAFGSPDTWSLKYNMVWDLLFDSHLFSPKVIEDDIRYDLSMENTYGTPLDCRASYTKSDWILWVAAMSSEREERRKLIRGTAAYLRETPSRFPFSDWYDTESGAYCHFKGRSVQGGIFMPILADLWRSGRRT
ncbi:MAG: DUF4965 domain-containing protein [Lachnospira sp.]|nr:DUF4965 domain-containing protein [Lachnospira sp.]